MIGIYKITNLVNGKIYIGQSRNIEERWRVHKKEVSLDYPLYRAFKKYGLDNFSFEIVELCSISELNEREYFFIKKFNSLVPIGYNTKLVGWNPSVDWETARILIQEIKNNFKTMTEISKEFGISAQTLSAINNGRSWVLDDEEYPLRKTLRGHHCIYCGARISSSKVERCRDCAGKMARKIERPSVEELTKELKKSNFVKVGQKYGVSDNAIRKWCKAYGMSTSAKDYK